MKVKLLKTISAAMALALVLTACGTSAPEKETQTQVTETPAPQGYDVAFKKATTDLNDYKTECDQKGTVSTIEYDAPAYAVNEVFGVEETVHKAVNVYLPYGYDEAKQYNVLYLLHGTKGETDDQEHMENFWLTSQQWGATTCNILDNMIKEGLCEPLIIVTPNYYSTVEGYEITDEQMKTLAEERVDSFLWTEVSETGGEPENDENIWPEFFGYELRNDIIPLVESQFSTYAAKDISEENLIATRDHRGFAGLSRGAMTVARSGLMMNTDMISYFGSFSGVWAEFNQFKNALTENFGEYKINYWYNGNGKGDFALNNHETFKDQVLTEMSDQFVDGENFAWVVLRDGAHAYSSWAVDLYNSLLVFFK